MLRHAGCRYASSSRGGGSFPISRAKVRAAFHQLNQSTSNHFHASYIAAEPTPKRGNKRHHHISERDSDFKSTRNPRLSQYGHTLQLPSNTFELKKPGQNDELLYRETTTSDLYKWQTEQSSRPTFTLHDGPPYANGSIHLGHCVNKVLKDIINRYRLLQGDRVHYVPGWDCHGLPIEQKVTGQFPGVAPSNVPATDLRPAARKFALKTAASQKEDFELLGIMADWSKESTYRTMDPSYEINQLKIFEEMVKRDLVIRAIKPVYWSPSSQTALAEAEVVHNPDHQSRSLYVRYHLYPGPLLEEVTRNIPEANRIITTSIDGYCTINAMIWTTTPWSLTANVALTVNPELSYSMVVPEEGPCRGEIFLIATDRIVAFAKVKIGLSYAGSKDRERIGPLTEIAQFSGSALLDSTYRHPFLPKASANRPVLGGSYVTSNAGTGLVHCAPAHGVDDYNTWQEYCQENPAARKTGYINAVDHTGSFSKEVDELLAEELEMRRHPSSTLDLGKAMGAGGHQITKMLSGDGWVLSEVPIQHTYPYDWRTNQPLVIRATPQWFVTLEKIKGRAIKALEKVRFVPETARTKLESLILNRNEWCISRQRAWGVPIPVLYNKFTGEALLTSTNIEHIIQILTEKGSDYWWHAEAGEFIAPLERIEGVEWVKGTDTMDVWFDSGSSWTILPGAQKDANEENAGLTSPVTSPANVYLEGTDQHRGWFQSSLLTHVAVSSEQDNPVAPYQTLVSHAFTVDRKGEKMSKSKMNVISPEFFLLGGPKNKQPAFGADPLRWWVARIDFTSDIIVSALAIKHASDELRKIRNTFRFLLSYVPLPNQVPAIEVSNLEFTEQYMMHTLRDLNLACKQAYDNYDFAQVTRRVTEYANTLVSSFYIVIIKDMLYADAKESKQRQAVLIVLNHIFMTLLSAVGPFAPHLAEEVWHFYNGAQSKPKPGEKPTDSFFRNSWHTVPMFEGGEQVKEDMMVIFRLRTTLQSKMEQLRQDKEVKSSLGVQVKLLLPKTSKVASILERRKEDLPKLFQMAHCDFVDQLPTAKGGQVWPSTGYCDDTEVEFAIELSKDAECPRCRQFTRKEEEKICKRCHQVVADLIESENGTKD